jgi:hypothetical protein
MVVLRVMNFFVLDHITERIKSLQLQIKVVFIFYFLF